MMIRRGQVWWAELGEPHGSAPGFRRPVLILQRDEVNASRLNTVVVCALTGNTAHATAPGNTLLPASATGLPRPSVANASQILTLDRVDLDSFVATLSKRWIDRVGRNLKWFLDLE